MKFYIRLILVLGGFFCIQPSLQAQFEWIDIETPEILEDSLKGRISQLQKLRVQGSRHNKELERIEELNMLYQLLLARYESDSMMSTGERDTLKILTATLQKELNLLEEQITTLQYSTGITNYQLDRFWILIAAAMVFLMQGGFMALEVGMVRPIHGDGVGMKNLFDWMVVALVFYLVGYKWMFGSSVADLGGNIFQETDSEQPFGFEFFLYQLAFAGTAATIISGALSERTRIYHYAFISLIVGLFIYPVFGRMVWGGIINPDSDIDWLAQEGFMDFAGATVVHSIGAWVALAGVIVIGKRKSRIFDFHDTGLKPSNLGFSALGVLLLWFGWWGFNGGSALAFNESVGQVILHTNLAGAAAGVTAFVSGVGFYLITRTSNNRNRQWRGSTLGIDKNNPLEKRKAQDTIFAKTIGGALGGLVAITACCNVVTDVQAVWIGVIAGLFHNLAYNLLIIFKWDDPVGAIPVHGMCGLIGTICLAVFGNCHQFTLNQDAYDHFLSAVHTQIEKDATLTIGELQIEATPLLEVGTLPQELQNQTVGAFQKELPAYFGAQSPPTLSQIPTYLYPKLPVLLEDFPADSLPQSRDEQLLIQLIGVVIALLFAGGIGFFLFWVLKLLGIEVEDPLNQNQAGTII